LFSRYLQTISRKARDLLQPTAAVKLLKLVYYKEVLKIK